MEYVRFRSKYPNANGLHIGVFGLVNVLGRRGMLNPGEEQFRRENNAWYDAAYPDPPVYDESLSPHAAAWFKSTASELIDRVAGYLSILNAHHIAWEEVRTASPGTIIHADEFQVVAEPADGK